MFRVKQREIKEKMNKLHHTDEKYYLTLEYLLKLAQDAEKLFESSEAHEKGYFWKWHFRTWSLKVKQCDMTG